METLEGRVAVVTGGGSGIGEAIATALAVAGNAVAVVDLHEETAQRVAGEIAEAHGVETSAHQADVTDPEALERVATDVVERFGHLHVAVNSAGIVNGGRSWELDLAEWHRVIDTNLWGVIHGVRAFVPHLLATGDEGHVVNIGSMASVQPHANLGPYTVAKHGVLGLSDVLRAELAAEGDRIGVSVVFPGMIRTGMNPIGTVEPSVVAANVMDAIRRRRPYVFTDDHATDAVERRLGAILAARADVLP